MTTRADVERLSSANRSIVKMARADLAGLFAGMDLSRPELVRDALVDAVPALVREYGNLAAAVAADWYEELRVAAGVKGVHREQLSPGADPEAVAGSVRAGSGGLFTGDTASSLAFIEGALQRHISYSTRDTIRRNVAGDPSRPRYARVPSGAKTCAFCELRASRGFVYHSAASAGEGATGIGDDWHDDCDCSIVVSWDRENAHIEGYDPDAMYDKYRKAYLAGDGTEKGTLANMRRDHPEHYTDGVLPKKED